MKPIRITAACPCEACARLAGVVTVRVAEDRRVGGRQAPGLLLPSPTARPSSHAQLPETVRWILAD
jgi:hypothetical protein